MRERLETILWLKRNLWLRPGTGALRGGLSQSATTGNVGIRIQGFFGMVRSETNSTGLSWADAVGTLAAVSGTSG
jgi:hypothetical protein